MRRYRLFEKKPNEVPVMMYLSVIMDDEEDLTIGPEEKAAGVLLRWLNERGATYHIEVNLFEPEIVDLGEFSFFVHSFERQLRQTRNHYDLLIYDDATATLMSLFHENFVEIVPPEVIAARQAEEKRLEAEAAEIAAQRERDDAENAKRVAKAEKEQSRRAVTAEKLSWFARWVGIDR